MKQFCLMSLANDDCCFGYKLGQINVEVLTSEKCKQSFLRWGAYKTVNALKLRLCTEWASTETEIGISLQTENIENNIVGVVCVMCRDCMF